MGFGLDDWIYLHHIHLPKTIVNYSAMAISTLYSSLLHPLVSSDFTSHILATDS
jgi:hypothetical protein